MRTLTREYRYRRDGLERCVWEKHAGRYGQDFLENVVPAPVKHAVRRALIAFEDLEDEHAARVGGPPAMLSTHLIRPELRARLLRSSEIRLDAARAFDLNSEAQVVLRGLINERFPTMGASPEGALSPQDESFHAAARHLAHMLATDCLWYPDRFLNLRGFVAYFERLTTNPSETF